jgi:hypothetical protein
MKKLFSTKKRIAAVGGAVGLAVAIAGGAFAYFTSSGNGTGSGTVGQSANWSVAQTSSSGTLYPCGATTFASGCSGDQETLTFTITNNDAGAQLLTYSNLQTAIDSATGTETPTAHTDIVTGGTNSQPNSDTNPTSNLTGATAVNNCQAAWFGSQITSLNGHQANVDVAGSGTATVVVTVSMEDAAASQNACQSQTPDVDLWVS